MCAPKRGHVCKGWRAHACVHISPCSCAHTRSCAGVHTRVPVHTDEHGRALLCLCLCARARSPAARRGQVPAGCRVPPVPWPAASPPAAQAVPQDDPADLPAVCPAAGGGVHPQVPAHPRHLRQHRPGELPLRAHRESIGGDGGALAGPPPCCQGGPEAPTVHLKPSQIWVKMPRWGCEGEPRASPAAFGDSVAKATRFGGDTWGAAPCCVGFSPGSEPGEQAQRVRAGA